MTKAIIFDLDGTLIDTAPDLINSLNFVLNSEDLDSIPYDKGRACIGLGARKMIEMGLDSHNVSVSEEKLDQLFELFLKHYEDNIAVESRPFEGAIEAVDKFIDNGWEVAICTNKLERLAKKLLKELGILDRFTVVTGGDTYGVGKPDPKPIRETMKLIGGTVDSTIMVGDSLPDIEGARNAGIRSVAVDFGYAKEDVREFRSDGVISCFDVLRKSSLVFSSHPHNCSKIQSDISNK